MPSASKGETWPKRLPRPGPLGSKVSKLWKSIIRPISGAIRTTKDAAGPSAGAGCRGEGAAAGAALAASRHPRPALGQRSQAR